MLRWITLFLIAFLWPVHAFALAGEWQKDDTVAARLISGVEGIGTGATVPLGLEILMQPEWHTYWRSPGMAGLPPQIDWQNSLTDTGNLKDAALLYPAPRRYTAYGLETVGYREHVIFPIEATLRAAGHALNLEGNVSILVCSAICVPKNFTLKLTVPEGAAADGPETALLKSFRDQVPVDTPGSGLILKSVVNDGETLTIAFESRHELTDPDLFVESDDISFGAAVGTVSSDHFGVVFKIKPADTLPEGKTLAGMPLTLTAVNGEFALERKIFAPPVSQAPPAYAPPPLPLWLALVFALIGGFILNLMPCVLPVLSLKVLSAIGHGGGEAPLVRRSFLVTAAGIIFSFLAMALMTILLKTFGLMLGWGVQFQQPLFVAALVFVLTLFAANMWGMFEIPLPRWLADRIGSLTVPAPEKEEAEESKPEEGKEEKKADDDAEEGVPKKHPYHPKLLGDFFAGAFATLLATPCTAPFLGTAVGFALAAGPFTILAIFLALGLGMSVPCLAVAAYPKLAIALPKPGAWMARLRHILGAALALTALWLLWVLAAQIGARLATLVGLCMIGFVILLALRKTSLARRAVNMGLIEFVIVAIMITLAGSLAPKKVAPEADRLWLPFNEHALAADIDEGKTVFVDVTADWCLTCKANKKFVLSQGDIDQRLFGGSIIAMQADWTNADPAIAEFLHKYGRYGIPFNIVFGPGAPRGIVLPELLTHDKVMEALDKAEAASN